MMKLISCLNVLFALMLICLMPMQAEARGLFPGEVFATGATPESATTADFNGDGNMDLAVANGGSDNVSVLLGDGAGGFATATNFAAGTLPVSVISADFNGDGKSDILWRDSLTGNTVIWMMNGFTVVSSVNIAQVTGGWTIVP
jgi:hypothetical protein